MDAADFHPDPIAQFHRWLEEAVAAGVEMPEAMTLATADAEGRPSARTVLLKSAAEDGFRFFTNTESRKGRELAENPNGALVFHWPQEPRRQVTVAGPVAPLPRDEAEEYFRTRPLGSRLGAWASRQTDGHPGARDARPGVRRGRGGIRRRPAPAALVGRLPPDAHAARVLAEPPEPPSRPLPLRAGRRLLAPRAPRSLESLQERADCGVELLGLLGVGSMPDARQDDELRARDARVERLGDVQR